MEIIPVLDIRSSVVVRARGGDRTTYAPIESALVTSSDPIDVVQGYLKLYPFRRLYVADLNGIEGEGRSDQILARLRDAFPDIEFWVDNGLAKEQDCRNWSELNLGRLVLGSESQEDPTLPRRIDAILSLDFRGDAFLGPQSLLHDLDLWPEDVIVMTLSRVGSGGGPDLDRIAAIRRKSANARIYAAGGVRNAADLAALWEAGAAGVLVASALHDGRIGPRKIALALADEFQSPRC